MSKDPAILFYTSDFIIGTAFLTHEQVGKYIRLLCYQHQAGRMTKEQVISVIGKWDSDVMDKFILECNLYYNKRLEEESIKRKAFCESRRLSRTSNVRQSHVPRTVNENENEDVNDNKDGFDVLWGKYPKRVGRKNAQRHFKSTVKTEKDKLNIEKALSNYLSSERVLNGFVQNGSTWFNNWQDWIEFREEVCPKCKGKGKFVSSTGYEIMCDCPKGKNP